MSEFPHYQQPSSLPSNYALMSHFNPELDPDELEAELEEENGSLPEESSQGISIQQNIDPTIAGPFGPVSYAIKRRRTMSAVPTTANRPNRQTLSPLPGTPAFMPESVFVDERAPLLRSETAERLDKEEGPKSFWYHFGIELKVLCRYSFPILASQVLEYSLIVASVISIGHIGTDALAGSTLGNMTGSVTGYSIALGFICALDTLLPAAWTSDDPRMVGLWTQRMVVLMSILLVPMFVIWFNTESILLLLHQDPEVARYAGLYLKYASVGLPAYTYNAIAKRYFQSQGLMHVPTVATAIVAPLNLFLNWLLVWGPDPVRLGFKGAPLATAFSFNLMLVVFLIYGCFFAPKTAWCPISRRSFTRLGDLVSLGIAGVGMTVSEWWSWEIVALAASLLGPAALAAQSVILSTCSGLWQASNALSIAAAVRVGNLLGAGLAREASLACKVSLFMALCAASLMCSLLVCFRHSMCSLPLRR
ncbi:mate-domain-containing protein [Calocera viscosa TUFC12733]|uniref:Mate-domain-containing protein n=1 Tax=Calocera viscosa (strain TUFC12733) TaxID=1330018 RepID=A0A167P643_CALVF|nr:mate-domain-containing protein [Calocera viscosa TUFC12733]